MDSRREEMELGLRALGIEPEAAVLHLLTRHLELVYEANRAISLTSIEIGDAVPLHVLDSAAALPFLENAAFGPFVDLGSGPGYPGIPLTVLSGRPVVLVESVGKKAAFLERAVAELRLEATVQGIRAEQLAIERAGSFTAVTARALSSLPSLIELAAPLLSHGGVLVCLKGRPEDDELRRGGAVAGLCGMELGEAADVAVPGVEAVRTIVTYRRVRTPSLELPRRTGLAQRRPLA